MLLGFAAMVMAQGCGLDFRPVIVDLEPAAGRSTVPLNTTPVIEVAEEVSYDIGTTPQVRLVDLSAGNRTLGGALQIRGTTLTYLVEEDLAAGHRFELVIEEGLINGEKLLVEEASEWPPEPFDWPLRLRFSTASHLTVRAVYLDRSHDAPRLFVRFSQTMDQVVSNDRFALFDQLDDPLPFSGPVWVDGDSARLDLKTSLDPAGLYTLIVDAQAQAADGAGLDGDGDGRVGPSDDFTTQFTGSELIIRSRLKL